eukprot:351662_1
MSEESKRIDDLTKVAQSNASNINKMLGVMQQLSSQLYQNSARSEISPTLTSRYQPKKHISIANRVKYNCPPPDTMKIPPVPKKTVTKEATQIKQLLFPSLLDTDQIATQMLNRLTASAINYIEGFRYVSARVFKMRTLNTQLSTDFCCAGKHCQECQVSKTSHVKVSSGGVVLTKTSLSDWFR